MGIESKPKTQKKRSNDLFTPPVPDTSDETNKTDNNATAYIEPAIIDQNQTNNSLQLNTLQNQSTTTVNLTNEPANTNQLNTINHQTLDLTQYINGPQYDTSMINSIISQSQTPLLPIIIPITNVNPYNGAYIQDGVLKIMENQQILINIPTIEILNRQHSPNAPTNVTTTATTTTNIAKPQNQLPAVEIIEQMPPVEQQVYSFMIF